MVVIKVPNEDEDRGSPEGSRVGILVRLDKDLREDVQRAARADGLSMNSWMVTAILRRLADGQEDG